MPSVGPSVRVFDDLASAHQFTRRWLPEFAFDTTVLVESERTKLSALVGVEVDLADGRSDHEGFTRDFLTRVAQHPVLITLEYKSSPPRPVRSHKGLFYDSPRIRAGSHAELEIDVGGGYTHFVGLAVITDSNVDECIAKFGNGLQSFIVIGESELPMTMTTARCALRCAPDLPGLAYLDYAIVAAEFCDGTMSVARMAGYGNSGDAALQFFSPSSQARVLVNDLTALLRKAEIG